MELLVFSDRSKYSSHLVILQTIAGVVHTIQLWAQLLRMHTVGSSLYQAADAVSCTAKWLMNADYYNEMGPYLLNKFFPTFQLIPIQFDLTIHVFIFMDIGPLLFWHL